MGIGQWGNDTNNKKNSPDKSGGQASFKCFAQSVKAKSAIVSVIIARAPKNMSNVCASWPSIFSPCPTSRYMGERSRIYSFCCHFAHLFWINPIFTTRRWYNSTESTLKIEIWPRLPRLPRCQPAFDFIAIISAVFNLNNRKRKQNLHKASRVW